MDTFYGSSWSEFDFLSSPVVGVSTPCFRPCLDSLGASVTMEGWPWRYPKWPSSGRMAVDSLTLPWIVKKGDVSDTLQTFGIILTNIDMFGFFKGRANYFRFFFFDQV